MTKGLPRSLSRATLPRSAIQKQTIVVDAAAISVVGSVGVGFGSVVVGAFPEGNVLILGTIVNMQFSGSGSDSNLVDDWEGSYALGSNPLADATIGTGDADIAAEVQTLAASSEVSPVTRAFSSSNIGGDILNNTAGDLEMNLNLLIDDADISGTVDITATGEVYISYIILGDD